MQRGARERERVFREAYEEHGPAIHAYLARRVPRDQVHDLAAEVFTVAWRKMPKDVEEPLPWLYAVARRVVYGHLRRARSGSRLLERLKALESRDEAAPMAAADGLSPRMVEALSKLSYNEREALLLVAWEGLDHATAGSVVGCTAATFTVRLSRARTRLRAALEHTDANGSDASCVPQPNSLEISA